MSRQPLPGCGVEPAEPFIGPVGQVAKGGLGAEPAAPDPAKEHGDEQKAKDQDQHHDEEEVELLDAQARAEEEEGPAAGVQA